MESSSATDSFPSPPPPSHDFEASTAPPPNIHSSSLSVVPLQNDYRPLQEEEKMELEEKIETKMEIPGTVSLTNFCRQNASELKFTDDLKQILEVIASTGNYWHDWSMLKSLLSFRMKQVLTQYHDLYIASGGPEKLLNGETFPDLQRRLLECLDLFVDGPPFTLQRLCELLLNPTATYPNIDKVALAFEKLLLVTSMISACNDNYPSHTTESKVDNVSIVGIENGTRAPDKTDEEMLEISLDDDKCVDGKTLHSEPSSSSETNTSLTPKENRVLETDLGRRVQVLNQQPPLMDDDDFVDIVN